MTTDCTNVANYIVVVNDIVSLRAVYGRDTTAVQDFQVDVWDRTPLPTLADAPRVMAVMLEITARSGLKEKPATGVNCTALADSTRPDKVMDWIGGAVAGAGINVDPSNLPAGEWACYRYKLYQTRVPIRNMSWRP
jgi:type IV pilus assembly protein PilW